MNVAGGRPVSPIALITEGPALFVIVLHGDPEDDADLELVSMALYAGYRSGKPIAVDLFDVDFFTAGLLGTLLRPARRGLLLPWLVGPLSATARRRLDVTGTTGVFLLFNSLAQAHVHARPH